MKTAPLSAKMKSFQRAVHKGMLYNSLSGKIVLCFPLDCRQYLRQGICGDTTLLSVCGKAEGDQAHGDDRGQV